MNVYWKCFFVIRKKNWNNPNESMTFLDPSFCWGNGTMIGTVFCLSFRNATSVVKVMHNSIFHRLIHFARDFFKVVKGNLYFKTLKVVFPNVKSYFYFKNQIFLYFVTISSRSSSVAELAKLKIIFKYWM